MDQVVVDTLSAIQRGDWQQAKRLLHPYLHWTTPDGRTVRGRGQVLVRLAISAPTELPVLHELRDGQIYRWVEPLAATIPPS